MLTDPISRYQQTRCYRLGWVFERTGWAAMALVIAAAVLGLFGDGLLGSVEVKGPGGVSARYARFARAHAPLELTIEWPARATNTELWIERKYLAEFAIEEIFPPPAAVTYSESRVHYSFRATEPSERMAVSFRLRAEQGGRVAGSLGTGEEPALELRQLLFP